MRPTPEQLKSLHHILVSTVAPLSECLTVVIEHWESIRPKGQAAPEWIPINEREPTRHDEDQSGDILWLSTGGDIASQSSGFYRGKSQWTHWIHTSALAALPKRPPAPKPTPEEIEEAEFQAWWIAAEFDGDYKEYARQGWKAAKKGLTTP